jgi:hypothetical protein
LSESFLPEGVTFWEFAEELWTTEKHALSDWAVNTIENIHAFSADDGMDKKKQEAFTAETEMCQSDAAENPFNREAAAGYPNEGEESDEEEEDEREGESTAQLSEHMQDMLNLLSGDFSNGQNKPPRGDLRLLLPSTNHTSMFPPSIKKTSVSKYSPAELKQLRSKKALETNQCKGHGLLLSDSSEEEFEDDEIIRGYALLELPPCITAPDPREPRFDFPNHCSIKVALEFSKANNLQTCAFRMMATKFLSMRGLEDPLMMANLDTSIPLNFGVIGPPGTGKSHLFQTSSAFHTSWNRIPELLVGTEYGSCAAPLGGATIAKLGGMRMPKSEKDGKGNKKKAAATYSHSNSYTRTCKTLFLDELSLINGKNLYHAGRSFCEAYSAYKRLFEGINVVLLGDPMQQYGRDSPFMNATSNEIKAAQDFFESFEFFIPLTEENRQTLDDCSDPVQQAKFMRFIKHSRFGNFDQEDLEFRNSRTLTGSEKFTRMPHWIVSTNRAKFELQDHIDEELKAQGVKLLAWQYDMDCIVPADEDEHQFKTAMREKIMLNLREKGPSKSFTLVPPFMTYQNGKHLEYLVNSDVAIGEANHSTFICKDAVFERPQAINVESNVNLVEPPLYLLVELDFKTPFVPDLDECAENPCMRIIHPRQQKGTVSFSCNGKAYSRVKYSYWGFPVLPCDVTNTAMIQGRTIPKGHPFIITDIIEQWKSVNKSSYHVCVSRPRLWSDLYFTHNTTLAALRSFKPHANVVKAYLKMLLKADATMKKLFPDEVDTWTVLIVEAQEYLKNKVPTTTSKKATATTSNKAKAKVSSSNVKETTAKKRVRTVVSRSTPNKKVKQAPSTTPSKLPPLQLSTTRTSKRPTLPQVQPSTTTDLDTDSLPSMFQLNSTMFFRTSLDCLSVYSGFGAWLNDEVMRCYALLLLRNQPSIYFMNSVQSLFLLQGKADPVSFRRICLSYNTIVFPFHFQGNHWSFFMLHFNYLFIFDSLDNKHPRMNAKLKSVYENLGVDYGNKVEVVLQQRRYQNESYNCGLYVLQMIQIVATVFATNLPEQITPSLLSAAVANFTFQTAVFRRMVLSVIEPWFVLEQGIEEPGFVLVPITRGANGRHILPPLLPLSDSLVPEPLLFVDGYVPYGVGNSPVDWD